MRSGLNSKQAVEKLLEEFPEQADVAYLIDFVRTARKGVVRALPGRRGAQDENDE